MPRHYSRSGLAYIGDVQLELIQPCDEQPSVYREALDRGVTGLHHYCFLVEDYAACYARALASGYQPVVNAGREGWLRMTYMESQQIPGLLIELIEWNDNSRPYFDGVREMLAEADPGGLLVDRVMEGR